VTGAETDSCGACFARLRKLQDCLATEGHRCLLVSHLPNIRYLSGFTGSSALLLVRPDDALLVTDFRYEEQAAAEVGAMVEVSIARHGLLGRLVERLLDRPVEAVVAFECDRLTVRDRRELGERCAQVEWKPTAGIVERLRECKDAGELALIRRAARIADEALEQVLSVVREGAEERELAAELEYRLRRGGSDAVPFESIVAAGPRSALPHAHPSSRKICEGDLLLFDFGARVDGYCSDMTRTVCLGPAAPWQREIHEAVAAALEAGTRAVRAGVTAREVDAAARSCLEQSGWAQWFGHGTGHGIGLEVHESPRLFSRSDDLLAAGQVVTIEPGVYLPDRGGVRIEDDVLVNADGREVLTGFRRSLIEIP